jgi:hypothetical protein
MNERTMTFARGAGTLLLTFLGACGARYEIGEVGSGGSSGATYGPENGGVGGTSTGSAASPGGSTATGGSSDDGGFTAAGGSSIAGSTSDGGGTNTGGMSIGAGTQPSPSRTENPSCMTAAGPPAPFIYGAPVTPTMLADRVKLLLGSTRPLTPPDQTTPEAAANLVDTVFADAYENHVVLDNMERLQVAMLYYPISIDQRGIRVANSMGSTLVTPGSTLEDLIGPSFWKDPDLLSALPDIGTRGTAMRSAVFCGQPLDLLPEDHPTGPGDRRTTDAAVGQNPSCLGCHSLIDPLGDSLDNYDFSGKIRTADDSGYPIDTSGTYESPGDQFFPPTTFTFTGIDDLAPQFRDSCEAVRCVALTYSRIAFGSVGLPPLTQPEFEHVVLQFTANQLTLESLAQALVQTPRFLQ